MTTTGDFLTDEDIGSLILGSVSNPDIRLGLNYKDAVEAGQAARRALGRNYVLLTIGGEDVKALMGRNGKLAARLENLSYQLERLDAAWKLIFDCIPDRGNDSHPEIVNRVVAILKSHFGEKTP